MQRSRPTCLARESETVTASGTALWMSTPVLTGCKGRYNGDPLIRSVLFGCGADVGALSLFADKAEELHGS